MKSEITEPAPKPSSYPCLKRIKKEEASSGDLFVVLFSAPRVGAVVAGQGKAYPIGDHSVEWAAECFEDFHGEVTLSN